MICPKCGNQIADDSKFCPLCGADVTAQAEQPAAEAQPVYTYETPVQQPQPSNLVWGILSIALSELFIVGAILGIIFGKKAQRLAAEYTQLTGKPVTGTAKVGAILGKIGFILGIVMVVIWSIYLVVVIISGLAIGLSGSSSFDYYSISRFFF